MLFHRINRNFFETTIVKKYLLGLNFCDMHFFVLCNMSLFIASLNSGSNGNCYYIGNEHEAVLIDAGLTCRETESRMNNLSLKMQHVKAIFISHEHSDHIKGVEVLSRKYKLPIYIAPLALKNSYIQLEEHAVKSFKENTPIIVGNLAVIAFEKLHDAAEPYSFVVEGNGVKVGVFTDIGAPCKHVIHYFRQCHAAFLETNYDEQMLEQGRYPSYLKKRIRSKKGHLSNLQALDLFIDHRPEFMSHLFLSHLSKDNNCPDLVHKLFALHAKNVEIIIASRSKETPVYHIRKAVNNFTVKMKSDLRFQAVQMSLFEN